MTISSPSKHGPNISEGTEIKFSTLRKYFLKMNPKTSFSQSDSESSLFDAEIGSVSASQLLRKEEVTNDNNASEYSEINTKIPIVPDCTENSSISSSANWKLSQFVGSIKYYYIQQSTASSPTNDDLNVVVNNLSWNSNLDKSIRKIFFIDGTIGSNTTSPSLSLTSESNNLSYIITGNVYGSSGLGGGQTGNDTVNGLNGGDALSINNSTGVNNYINLLSSSKLYAGAGGGAQGGNGGQGGQGGLSCFNYGTSNTSTSGFCTGNGFSGAGGPGGLGGNGRGYSNLTGSLQGAPAVTNWEGKTGTTQSKTGGCGSATSGKGGDGGRGGNGGNGGDWNQPGTTGTLGAKGGDGVNGTMTTSTCGYSVSVPAPTGTGNPGTGVTPTTKPEVVGNPGKAIRLVSGSTITLFGSNTETLKGLVGA